MISKICPITGLKVIQTHHSTKLPDLPNYTVLNYEVIINNVPTLIQSLHLSESLIIAEGKGDLDVLTSQRSELISLIERKDLKVKGIFTWYVPRDKKGLIYLRDLLHAMSEKKMNS